MHFGLPRCFHLTMDILISTLLVATGYLSFAYNLIQAGRGGSVVLGADESQMQSAGVALLSLAW